MIQIGDMNGDGLTLLVLNWFEVKKTGSSVDFAAKECQ